MKYTSIHSLVIFACYILSVCMSSSAFGQTLKVGDGIQVVHFNAGWNAAADVEWVDELTNCKIKKCDIAADTKAQSKYEIVVVPTIIVFKDGEEVKRFQADISFSMKATKEDVQEVVDDSNMDSF
jgi:thiol-disulfide isomerase/thioredoxin